jgi:hypothetical protein
MNVQTDAYGPLNVYNSMRMSSRNPGQPMSMYSVNGDRRMYFGTDSTELPDSDDEYESIARPAAGPAAEARPAAAAGPRRSTRQQGLPAGFIADDCGGEDPITLKRINVGFRLECEQYRRCYDANTVASLNPRKSPFTREDFTPKDNARIDAYIQSKTGGKRGKNKKTKRKRSKRGKTRRR